MQRFLRRFRRARIKYLACWCSCLLAPSLSVFAQPPRSVPAQFSFENRLAEIEISRDMVPREADAVLVACQGFVETDGSLSEPYCVTPEIWPIDSLGIGVSRELRILPQRTRIARHRDLLTTVIDAVLEQSFVPAQVDGEDVRALMNFSVVISCSVEACLTIPIPNHGHLYQEYGYNYVSPQPILPDNDWYEGFDYKLEWIGSWMPNIGLLDQMDRRERVPYTMSVAVGTDGVAYGGCLNMLQRGRYSLENLFLRTLERATASLGNVRFIPGFHENQPVPMRFYETSVARYRRSYGIQGVLPQMNCPRESPRNGNE